jgi:hypothetical protein
MWNELIRAYEAELAALEEARAAYLTSTRDLLLGLQAALKRSADLNALPAEVVFDIVEDTGGHALIQPALELRTSVSASSDTTVGVAAWVASTWGGPNAVLRVAMSLEEVPESIDLEAQRRSLERDSQASALPGVPYDPVLHGEFADEGWIRFADVTLIKKPKSKILSESADILTAFSTAAARWVA